MLGERAALGATPSFAADRADREATAAQLARAEAERVAGFLISLFEQVDPSRSRGNTLTAREILDSGAARIQSELADQPEVRGALLRTLGAVYESIGLYPQAEPLLVAAQAQARTPRDQALAAFAQHVFGARVLLLPVQGSSFAKQDPGVNILSAPGIHVVHDDKLQQVIAHHQMPPVITRLIQSFGIGDGAIEVFVLIQIADIFLQSLVVPYDPVKVIGFQGFEIAVQFESIRGQHVEITGSEDNRFTDFRAG